MFGTSVRRLLRDFVIMAAQRPCFRIQAALLLAWVSVILLASALLAWGFASPHNKQLHAINEAYEFAQYEFDSEAISILFGLIGIGFSFVFLCGCAAASYVRGSRGHAKRTSAFLRQVSLANVGLNCLALCWGLAKIVLGAVHDNTSPFFWALNALLLFAASCTASFSNSALSQELLIARVNYREALIEDAKRQPLLGRMDDSERLSSVDGSSVNGLHALQLSPLIPSPRGRRNPEADRKTVPAGSAAAASSVPVTTTEDPQEAPVPPRVNIARLLALAKADWQWIAVGFLALAVAAVATTALPLYTGNVVNAVAIKKDKAEFKRGIIILVGVAIVAAVFSGIRGSTLTVSFARLKMRLRQRLFENLLRQEIGYYDTVRTGDLVSRMAADVTKVGDSISLQLNVFLRNLIQAVGTLAFMFSLSWQLTIVVLTMIPPVTVLTRVYGAYIRRISKRLQKTVSLSNAVAQEILSSIATVRSMSAQAAAAQRHAYKQGQFLHVNMLQAWAYAWYAAMFVVLPNLVTAALLYAGGWLIFHGRVQREALVSFLLYQVSLTGSLASIADVFSGLMQAVGAADKIFRLIDREPEVKEQGTIMLPRSEVRGELAFKNVHFAYPTRPLQPVLRGFTLNIRAGQSVALVGGSGNGKSSVIRLLQRFYDPQQGDILLDGRPLSAYNAPWRRRIIALVQQEPTLMGQSVRDNITLGLESESLRWGDQLEDELSSESDEDGDGADKAEIDAIWGVDSDEEGDEGGIGGDGLHRRMSLDVEAGQTTGGAGTAAQRKSASKLRRQIQARREAEASGAAKPFQAPAWATETAFLRDMARREEEQKQLQQYFVGGGGAAMHPPSSKRSATTPHTADTTVAGASETVAWHSAAAAELENIYDPITGRVRQAAVEAAARLADAHAFISALPHGYDTLCGERGTALSGGQKQRIALARAILRNPVVLALDEATSALDATSEAAVQGAIDNLMADRSRTVMIVAHRLSTVRGCDVIAVVRDGRIVESGSHQELLDIRGEYFELVQRQLSTVE